MSDEVTYFPLGAFHVVISDSAVEETGLKPGALYEFQAHGGHALCRWDTTSPSIGDGTFTFGVAPGCVVRARCPTGNTLLNVIEAGADSAAAASLTISEITPA